MVSENPYQSPQQPMLGTRRRGVGLLRMMFSGLVVGTLVGLGAGAVAGAALFISVWVSNSLAITAGDSIAMAEYGAMQVFRGVFSGAIAGFVVLAPLGVVLGAAASLWQPSGKQPFVILSTVLNAILFAAVGLFLPQWPAPISALLTGAVGIGGGMMLGRVLADMAAVELSHADGRRR